MREDAGARRQLRRHRGRRVHVAQPHDRRDPGRLPALRDHGHQHRHGVGDQRGGQRRTPANTTYSAAVPASTTVGTIICAGERRGGNHHRERRHARTRPVRRDHVRDPDQSVIAVAGAGQGPRPDPHRRTSPRSPGAGLARDKLMRAPPRASCRSSATPIKLLASLVGFAVCLGASSGLAGPLPGTRIDNFALAAGTDAGGLPVSQRSDTVEPSCSRWSFVTLSRGSLAQGVPTAAVRLPHRTRQSRQRVDRRAPRRRQSRRRRLRSRRAHPGRRRGSKRHADRRRCDARARRRDRARGRRLGRRAGGRNHSRRGRGVVACAAPGDRHRTHRRHGGHHQRHGSRARRTAAADARVLTRTAITPRARSPPVPGSRSTSRLPRRPATPIRAAPTPSRSRWPRSVPATVRSMPRSRPRPRAAASGSSHPS